MKRIRKILLVILFAVLTLCAVGIVALAWSLRIETDYDSPESLDDLAIRTVFYLMMAHPDQDSPEYLAAMRELDDIALLDVSDAEKCDLIRARFPEESFWPDDLKALLRDAESGDMEAQYRLGGCYSNPVILSEADRAKRPYVVVSGFLAAKWFRKAALQGHADAQYLLSECYKDVDHPLEKGKVRASRREEEFIKAERLRWLRKSAANGNMYAQWDLAGEENDPDAMHAAERRIQEAAEQGDEWALSFSASITTPEIYRKNAERGSVLAMCEWSSLLKNGYYIDGKEFPKDEVAAKEWKRKAFDLALKHLEEGNALDLLTYLSNFNIIADFEDDTIFDLPGIEEADKTALAKRIMDDLRNAKYDRFVTLALYMALHSTFEKEGLIETQDEEEYLREMAALGAWNHEMSLADYLLDDDERTDEEKAEGIRRLRRFAGLGFIEARYKLGECYLDGAGVPQDKAEGVKWLRMAARQRHTLAMYDLYDALRDPAPPHGRLEAEQWRLLAIKDGEFDSVPEYWWWWTMNELPRYIRDGIGSIKRIFK